MTERKRLSNTLSFSLLLLLSIVFLFPLYLVLINSFKSKFNIISEPFAFPNDDTFVGLENYINGINSSGIIGAFIRTAIITVGSVLAIVVFTSMTAWYITRDRSVFSRMLYNLFLFSMIVPFQMVMYTMTYVTTKIGLNNPIGIIFIRHISRHFITNNNRNPVFFSKVHDRGFKCLNANVCCSYLKWCH